MMSTARSSRFAKSNLPRVTHLRAKHANDLRLHAAYCAQYPSPRSAKERRLHRNASAAFDLLLAADPTPNAMYLQTIIHWTLNHAMRFEDARTLRTTLERFHATKHQLPIALRDIRSHDGPGAIAALLADLYYDADAVLDPDLDGQEILARSEDWTLVKLTSSAAAKHWSKGTQWCTSSTSTAKDYLAQGPLLVLATRTQRFQMHVPSDQLMDKHDVPVGNSLDLPDEAIEALIAEALKPSNASALYHEVTMASRLERFLPRPPSVQRHLFGSDRFFRSRDGEWQFALSSIGPMHFVVLHVPSDAFAYIPPNWEGIAEPFRTAATDFLIHRVQQDLLHPAMGRLHQMTRKAFPGSLLAALVGGEVRRTIVIHGEKQQINGLDTVVPAAVLVHDRDFIDCDIYDLTTPTIVMHRIVDRAGYEALPERMQKAFRVSNAQNMQDLHLKGMTAAMVYGCDSIDRSIWNEMDWTFRSVILNSVASGSPHATEERLADLLVHLVPDQDTANRMLGIPSPDWTHEFLVHRARGGSEPPLVDMHLAARPHLHPAISYRHARPRKSA